MGEVKKASIAQDNKDAKLKQLKAQYQPLMESFLTLQREAQLMLDHKGDENEFYKALIRFATLVRESP